MPVHVSYGRMTKGSSSKKPAPGIIPAPASSLPQYLQQTGDGCSLAIRAKPGAKVLLVPCGLLEGECVFPSLFSIESRHRLPAGLQHRADGGCCLRCHRRASTGGRGKPGSYRVCGRPTGAKKTPREPERSLCKNSRQDAPYYRARRPTSPGPASQGSSIALHTAYSQRTGVIRGERKPGEALPALTKCRQVHGVNTVSRRLRIQLVIT